MYMRIIFVVLFGILFSVPALAANPSEKEKSPSAVGMVDCFDYYHFGSVQVDLSPILDQTVPGATLTFQGKIKNENAYPIVDGTVYVKIFKRTGQSDQNMLENGYPLVDQFLLPENFTVPAKGEKPASFHWTVPANAEGGE